MKKSFWINMLVVLSSIAFVFLMLEIILTFVDYPQSKPYLQEFYGPNFKLMCYDRPPSSGYSIDLRNDAMRAPYEKVFREQNNTDFFNSWKDTPYAVRVDFNAQGFREKEFSKKEPGKKRIVILGDSFTYGHGMDNSLSYPRVLEKLLHEQCPGGNYEVLNLGVGNTGINWDYSITPIVLKKLKPDILIYGYFFNDPQGKHVEIIENINDKLDEGWLKMDRAQYYFSLSAWKRSRPYSFSMIEYLVKSMIISRRMIKQYRDIHAPQAWAPTRAAIESMNRSAKEQNCRFIIVLLPIIYKVKESHFADIHTYIDMTMAESNVEVVDCLPALSKFDDKMIYLHPHDMHPNDLYHRKVAEAIISQARLCDLKR